MKMPPAPRTVEMENPDGVIQTVRAYTHDNVQRVLWDPEKGVWYPNLKIAHWERTSSKTDTGWTLATNREESNPPKLSERVDLLEILLAEQEEVIQSLQHRVMNLEQSWPSLPGQLR